MYLVLMIFVVLFPGSTCSKCIIQYAGNWQYPIRIYRIDMWDLTNISINTAQTVFLNIRKTCLKVEPER